MGYTDEKNPRLQEGSRPPEGHTGSPGPLTEAPGAIHFPTRLLSLGSLYCTLIVKNFLRGSGRGYKVEKAWAFSGR